MPNFSVREIKAVMIFVDFSNAPAGSASATDIANHLLGNGAAQKLFSTQSYGKMSMDVAVKSNLGWKRMALPSTSYSFSTFDTHKTYISAAASLFITRFHIALEAFSSH